jgi:hypothetical protein
VTINDDLTINSGVMYLNGFNLTANAARTTFSNNATVRLNGDEIISNLTQDTNNGIWEYVGTGGPYTIKDFGGGTDYYAMIINGSGATFNLGASLNLASSLGLYNGTLDPTASNYPISLASDWSKSSGNFITLQVFPSLIAWIIREKGKSDTTVFIYQRTYLSSGTRKLHCLRQTLFLLHRS